MERGITTHHVCAVGKVLCVGAAMIWKEGQRVLNPPGGSWEEPVVNCNRRANSSWVKLDTTAQNHFITCRNTKNSQFQTPSSLSCPLRETQCRWLTFSLKCHDPPTITAWALKSWTFISPVPHINSWGDEQRRLQFPSGSLRLNRLSLFTPYIPPTRSHQIWLAGFLEPVRSNLQFIRKLHQLCAHYLSSLMKETVTSGKKEQNTSACSYATLLTFQEVFHLISHLAG